MAVHDVDREMSGPNVFLYGYGYGCGAQDFVHESLGANARLSLAARAADNKAARGRSRYLRNRKR